MYHLIAYKIFYLMVYFVLNGVYQFVILSSGVPFPKLQTFSGIFWVLPIDYSLYGKTVLGIFNFYKQCSQAATRLICERAILAQNAIIVFNSNIPLYIEKNPLEKLCKILEMELKFKLLNLNEN